LRHVARWRRHGTATEQELLALLLEDFVRLLRGQVEAVLVDDLLRVLDPVLPGLGRDVVVDALAQSVVERLVGEAGELLTEFHALDHTAHGGGIARNSTGRPTRPTPKTRNGLPCCRPSFR